MSAVPAPEVDETPKSPVVPAPVVRLPYGPGDPQWSDAAFLLREFSKSRNLVLRNRLVELHGGLVRYLASKFANGRGSSLEDLMQVGYMGLIAAIERFDPDKGVSFVTYAVPTIAGEIKRYFRDHTWGVKAPRRLRELGLSLRKLRERLEYKLGRSPTIQEMAEAAGVTEELLLSAMDLERVYQSNSLDAMMEGEEGRAGASYSDTLGGPDHNLQQVDTREAVRSALGVLDERERTIIYHRFYGEASQSDLARRLGISQMHVSRLERKALKKLKAVLV